MSSQIVIRGENVYKCDVCSRKIRVPANPQGLDVLPRCNITFGCQGKLHRVTIAKDINNTPAFPPEIVGVQDWFQRKILFTFNQTIESNTWTINHNLENRPILYVFINSVVNGVVTLVPAPLTYKVTTVDLNTTVVTFDTAQSGLVQCVTLASQNTTNPNALTTTAPSTAAVQLTNNNGDLTIATLNTNASIGLTLTYLTPSATLNVEYVGISNIPSVNSPWAGVPRILINGKKYTVRSFNLVTTELAPSYFSTGAIVNNVSFYFSKINGIVPSIGDGLILLAQSPYATVDRIYNQYVDVASINNTTPEVYYSNGKGYTAPTIIKQTYPPIVIVTQ